MEDTCAEIKLLARQHVRDIARHPDREEMLEEIYSEQLGEPTLRLEGLRNQMQLAAEKHNTIVNVNRIAKTVIDVFDTILNKDTLTKTDVDFMIERITVYEDHIDIQRNDAAISEQITKHRCLRSYRQRCSFFLWELHRMLS